MRILVALTFLIFSCQGSTPESVSGQLEYYLDRSATNQTTNKVIFKFDDESKHFSIAISGIGFDAGIPFNSLQPIQESFDVTYTEEAIYTIGIRVYNASGIKFIDDQISWDYSLERPKDPIVSFDEAASSDELVTMLFAGNHDLKTNAVWLEGDVTPFPEGSWYFLPGNLRLPIILSDDDGLKNIRVKYRNIYGNESDEVDVSIIRKSSIPDNCTMSLGSSGRSNRLSQRAFLSAPGNGVMLYKFTGDVDPNPTREFTDSTTTSFDLSPGKGTKNISIVMTDLAGNPCPAADFSLEYDPAAEDAIFEVKDKPLFTETTQLNLVNGFDFLPSDQPQMYIFGPHVVEDDNTQKWVDYQVELPITLTEIDGERDIFVKYRLNPTANPTATLSYIIYLRPRIWYQNLIVRISDMDAMASVDIVGCSEVYSNQTYKTSYPCTPTLSPISAIFTFKDGSTLTKTVVP